MLPQQAQGTRHVFLLSNGNLSQQWSKPKHSLYQQTSQVISNQRRTGSTIYHMAREGVYIQIILEKLRHKQLPTPVQAKNVITDDLINSKVQQKGTKAMDRRFPWLQDREYQE